MRKTIPRLLSTWARYRIFRSSNPPFPPRSAMTSTEGNESQEPSGGLLAAGHPLPSLRPHKNRNCSSRSAVTDEHPRPASYYESFAYPYAAIDREKEIKG